MVTFRRVEWEGETLDEFVLNGNEHYRERYGEDMNNDQLDWMQLIYEEYNVNGEIDWTHSSDNDAWYIYCTEVLGWDDDKVDRYSES
jgi:hypothetical protein